MRLNNVDEAIQYALAQRIGNASDMHIVNETIVSIWQQMAQQLEPIIGAQGTDALFNRSLHLIHKDFPWIVSADNKSNSAILIQGFLKSFEGRDTNLITKASYKLLVTFTQLLTALIGEPLTNRLLNPVLVTDITEKNPI